MTNKQFSIEDVDGHFKTGFYWHHGPGFMLKTSDETVKVLYCETETKRRVTEHRFISIQWLNNEHLPKRIGFLGKDYTYYDGHYLYSLYFFKLSVNLGFTWYSTPII